MTVAVVAYFLVFAFVFGWLLYNVQGHLAIKTLAAALMFYTSTTIVLSFGSYMGWPTKDKFAPDNMIITSVLIFDKSQTTEGYIYITGIPCGDKSFDECMESTKNETYLGAINVFDVLGYVPPVSNMPRLYEFPYTEENRKMFAEARENIAEGGSSVLKRGKKGDGSGVGKGEDGEGDGAGDGDGSESGSGGTGGLDETPNAMGGAAEIYVDNRSLKDFLRKDDRK
jgi:uncharacterized membrane protein YgcG